MESIPFLKVEQESIFLNQFIKYLRVATRLQPIVGEFLRYYILDQELAQHPEIKIEPFQIDQSIMDFRLEHQLADPQIFQRWLITNLLTYEEFYQQMAFNLKIEQLKLELTQSKVETYFSERKLFLEQVVLSRIIVEEPELAENLKQKILHHQSSFEQLARENSITSDRIVNGMIGAISRAQIQDPLKTAIETTQPGEIIGPLAIEGRYFLFRIEQFIHPVLDEATKHDLQNQLFEQWLQEKLQKLTVKLEMI